MKVSWRRGFIRAGVVMSLAWILVVGTAIGVPAVSNYLETREVSLLVKENPSHPALNYRNRFRELSPRERVSLARELHDRAAKNIYQAAAMAFAMAFIPIVMLFVLGMVIGWVVRGFRE